MDLARSSFEVSFITDEFSCFLFQTGCRQSLSPDLQSARAEMRSMSDGVSAKYSVDERMIAQNIYMNIT